MNKEGMLTAVEKLTVVYKKNIFLFEPIASQRRPMLLMVDTPDNKKSRESSTCTGPRTVVHIAVCANDSPATAKVKESEAPTRITF